MTSRERILSAVRSMETDYIPMVMEWNEGRMHEKLKWMNERQKLEVHRINGWDTYLSISPSVTPAENVIIDKIIEPEGDNRFIRQTWNTPSGEITEKLKVTDDWDELRDGRPYLQFMSDFRTSRYMEFPFKDMKDLDALEYLFPVDNPADTKAIIEEYKSKRQLADEFSVPLFTYFDAGMDWLVWLFPPEAAILRIVEDPEFMHKLLSHINKAKHKRLELLLKLGIDGVMRRGWYESTDLWSPAIFREFAKPALEKEIEMTHDAGIPYIYIMDTGITPLLPDLASLRFDCLLGVDPDIGRQDMRLLRQSLPGKAIWGGFSGPGHFGADTPEKAAKAVENAIEICGKRGLILGMAVSFRYYWPWENFEAAESAWKRLR